MCLHSIVFLALRSAETFVSCLISLLTLGNNFVGSGQPEQCFEAVDVSCGNNITGLAVCQSTGNLIMARNNYITNSFFERYCQIPTAQANIIVTKHFFI